MASTKDNASLFVAKQAKRYPQFAEHYERFHDLYDRKLFHQLTKALYDFIFNDDTFLEDNMIKLYLNFICKFQDALNCIELSRLIVRISKQFTNLEDALKFLDQICLDGKSKANGGNGLFPEESVGWMMIQCEIGHIYLIGNLVKQCKEIMDRVTELMEGKRHYYTQHALYSQYYRICLQYYKMVGDAHKYLDAALKFLTHTNAQDLAQTEQRLFASDICLAALLSNQCYNFSLLLSHDLIQMLSGTEHDWLYRVICIFNTGNLSEWNTFSMANAQKLKTEETIKGNLAFLEQKIRLMALIELVFQTPPNERLIPFSVISSQCQLQTDEVELVLIRAFSLQLLKGVIDEVDQTVLVTYCVPRSLQKSQINDLKSKIEDWMTKITVCKSDICKQIESHHL